ncbi:uncharacterized protein [Venturia canescens]|uniref:uncharacterized protein isoform X2 n=1 Tax=Venturia canescens TaxID=32260 RepID=UPI001C9CF0F0|nr:uncharacterized protein LOC122414464 isoform X2 [Venturia canescens]
MPKRKQDIIIGIEEKIRRLQSEIAGLQDSSSGEDESSHEEDGDSEDGEKIDIEDILAVQGKENRAPNLEEETPVSQNLPLQTEAPTDRSEKINEKELADEVLQVLGEDPSASNALNFDLHSSIASRWKFWVSKGMSKEEKKKLLDKYPRKEGFLAPELNRVMVSVMSESSVRRDSYATRYQETVGSALMALGAAVSTLLDEPESIDKLAFLENLNDAAKLMADTHFQINQSRRALILPGVSKPLKELLDKTKSDSELFGKNLTEKISETKALEKMGRTVKSTEFVRPVNPQGRQRLPFRGKQQVYNNRATHRRQQRQSRK